MNGLPVSHRGAQMHLEQETRGNASGVSLTAIMTLPCVSTELVIELERA